MALTGTGIISFVQTPLWVPLLVATIGLIATVTAAIAGVLITQRRSDRREEKTWQRERERERERWSREDQARTFEHRRDAFAAFYEAVNADYMQVRIWREEHGSSLDDDKVPDEWARATGEKMQLVQLYATPKLANLALDLWLALLDLLVDRLDDEEFSKQCDRYRTIEFEVRNAIRNELGILPSLEPIKDQPRATGD